MTQTNILSVLILYQDLQNYGFDINRFLLHSLGIFLYFKDFASLPGKFWSFGTFLVLIKSICKTVVLISACPLQIYVEIGCIQPFLTFSHFLANLGHSGHSLTDEFLILLLCMPKSLHIFYISKGFSLHIGTFWSLNTFSCTY